LKILPKQIKLVEMENFDSFDLFQNFQIILKQEVQRYNLLIETTFRTTRDALQSLEGKVLISDQMDATIQNLLMNKVPQNLLKVSFQSSLGFTSWIHNLKERIQFLEDWICHGIPKIFWLSGLFSPNGFLTALQ
jgi:dynein heavy chain, axonemal